MKLATDLQKELAEALLDAFRSGPELAGMLELELNRSLNEITEAPNLKQKVLDVITRAESEDLVEELVAGARARNPTNKQLQDVASKFGQAAKLPREDLERIVLRTGRLLKVAEFRRKLAEIERRVCRIEIPVDGDLSTGTGFLVAADLVLTNYHVIAPMLTGDSAERAVARFDYGYGPDGTSMAAGKEVKLAAAWLVDWSPFSAVDRVDPSGKLPNKDELDHALLRLSSPVGQERIATDEQRGWIGLGASAAPQAEKALFIVQHPRGEPIQLALDGTVIDWNENRTRLRYSTSTLPGSSGSPCFDAEWRFAALHHKGERAYNEGIPAEALCDLFREHKVANLLGIPPKQ